MPEGDSVFKLADYLNKALAGEGIVTGFARTTESADLSGYAVSQVYARGKHLFIALDQDLLLRSHLGMWGSWHAYAPGEEWQKPRRQASIVLQSAQRVFVCFNAAQVELLRPRGVRDRVLDAALGPDLLAEHVAYPDILRRARELASPDTPVLDLLLDQRVACGIGNVYKSEVLFLQRLHPEAPVHLCSDEQVLGLYRQASQLLKGNRGGGPRITRRAGDDAGRLWVYRRAGAPCLRCDQPIRHARLGRDLRSTYWCPACQHTEP